MPGILIRDCDKHVHLALNEQDAVVEVRGEHGSGQRSVSVNIYILFIGSSLYNIQRADRGTSLRCIVEWSLSPLILLIE